MNIYNNFPKSNTIGDKIIEEYETLNNFNFAEIVIQNDSLQDTCDENDSALKDFKKIKEINETRTDIRNTLNAEYWDPERVFFIPMTNMKDLNKYFAQVTRDDRTDLSDYMRDYLIVIGVISTSLDYYKSIDNFINKGFIEGQGRLKIQQFINTFTDNYTFNKEDLEFMFSICMEADSNSDNADSAKQMVRQIASQIKNTISIVSIKYSDDTIGSTIRTLDFSWCPINVIGLDAYQERIESLADVLNGTIFEDDCIDDSEKDEDNWIIVSDDNLDQRDDDCKDNDSEDDENTGDSDAEDDYDSEHDEETDEDPDYDPDDDPYLNLFGTLLKMVEDALDEEKEKQCNKTDTCCKDKSRHIDVEGPSEFGHMCCGHDVKDHADRCCHSKCCHSDCKKDSNTRDKFKADDSDTEVSKDDLNSFLDLVYDTFFS